MTNAESLNNEVFPDGDKVLEDALGRNKDFWDAYAEESREDPVQGANIGGRLASRTITGTSESGAKIVIRDFDDEVFHRQPQPGVYDSRPVDEATGQLVQYRKGVAIEVRSGNDQGDSRSVELYVPDDAEAHPGIEPPHAATFDITHGGVNSQKIAPLENSGPEDTELFNKGLEEIKFYLGDRVVWDSPESREIPDQPIPHPLSGADL